MSESLEQEIRTLRAHFWSDRDPEGRAFAPLADAYRRKGDLTEAESLVQDGLGRLPDFATGRLIAAMVRRDQGRLDDAMAELDRLLELDARNVLGMVERAVVAALMGDREAAVEDAARALELEPGHPLATEVLRDLEAGPDGPTADGPVRVGPTRDAPPLDGPPLDAPALDGPPLDGPALDEDDQEPVGELEGLDLDGAAGGDEPPTPVHTRTLGELYARQGFPDRAVAVYETLLSEKPGDPELQARLEELREQAAGAGGPAPGTAAAGPGAAPRPTREAGEQPRDPEDRAPQWMEADSPAGAMDSAFAWSGGDDEEAAPAAGRPIGGYFQDLMAWVPGAVPVASLAPEGRGPVPIASLAPDSAGGGEPGQGEAPA